MADEAARLADGEPHRARELATDALVAAGHEGDASAASVAERALGFVAWELRELDVAVRHLGRAIAIAGAAGLRERAGQARRNLAVVLHDLGDTRGALREADIAAGELRGAELARLYMMRSLVLQRLGRMDEALAGYGRALDIFRRTGDRLMEARVLGNRGWLQGLRGAFGAAEADLVRAEGIFVDLGQQANVAKARHNLGLAIAGRGDVPRALAIYDDVEDRFAALGLPLALLRIDRAELLLSVHLVAEARRDAEAAARELAGARAATYHAEALLLLARAALMEGDPQRARAAADEARRDFSRQRRPVWAAEARLEAARAAWAAGDRGPAALRTARRAAAALEQAGLLQPALDARLMAARFATELGRPRVARHELLRASRARRSGLIGLRAGAWLAEATLREHEGDLRGAGRALRAGLRAVEQGRAALGATEMRAHAAGHGDELADRGLALALASGAPRRVLWWAERWRAGGLWLRPAQPPDDAGLARDLGLLRATASAVETAALDGLPSRALLARQAELERAIQRRARRAAGHGPGAAPQPPSPAELSAALGDRALLELVERAGALHGVLVVGGRVLLRHLGATADAVRELDTLRFALRRMASRHGAAPARAAVRDAALLAAARLDDALLGPVRREAGDRPLVVVPTGPLHAVPWAILPSCAGRPVAVAPSAALWLRAAAAPDEAPGRVAVLGGPGLDHAAREAAAVARAYPGARRLTGRRATVDAAAAALDGAHLAHVAAHGRFRADNPQFSALQLADGPLTVYDLERLGRAPRRIVLSACEAGLSEVRPGDELMGLAAALIALGTSTLVAGVGLVPDDATLPVMLALHRGLRRGEDAAAALAAAAPAAGGDEDAALAARAGFVCFGAG